MQMPDCYDPVRQAEWLESRRDKYTENLNKCALCDDILYPGTSCREANGKYVCKYCFDQLEGNVEIVEDIC